MAKQLGCTSYPTVPSYISCFALYTTCCVNPSMMSSITVPTSPPPRTYVYAQEGVSENICRIA